MELLTFYILGGLAIFSASAAVFAKNLFRSIIAFAVLLLSVAGFLALLYLPFLALGQLIIFVGGLISLLLFAVSFGQESGGPGDSYAGEYLHLSRERAPQIIAGVLFFLIVISAAVIIPYSDRPFLADFRQFSLALFRQYWEAVLIGVLALFAALVTAVFLLEED